MKRGRFFIIISLIFFVSCKSKKIKADFSGLIPENSKFVLVIPEYREFKRNFFKFVYNFPGLEGIVDYLKYNYFIDPEKDEEKNKLGIEPESPVAIFLYSSFWYVAISVSDYDKFFSFVAEKLKIYGYEKKGENLLESKNYCLVFSKKKGVVLVSGTKKRFCSYLHEEIGKIGKEVKGVSIKGIKEPQVWGKYYEFLSFVDPLKNIAIFKKYPFLKGIVYGMKSFKGMVKVNESGLSVDLRINPGANTSFLENIVLKNHDFFNTVNSLGFLKRATVTLALFINGEYLKKFKVYVPAFVLQILKIPENFSFFSRSVNLPFRGVSYKPSNSRLIETFLRKYIAKKISIKRSDNFIEYKNADQSLHELKKLKFKFQFHDIAYLEVNFKDFYKPLRNSGAPVYILKLFKSLKKLVLKLKYKDKQLLFGLKIFL